MSTLENTDENKILFCSFTTSILAKLSTWFLEHSGDISCIEHFIWRSSVFKDLSFLKALLNIHTYTHTYILYIFIIYISYIYIYIYIYILYIHIPLSHTMKHMYKYKYRLDWRLFQLNYCVILALYFIGVSNLILARQ